jgi:DNA-binding XRE family transcriptional regulator
VLRNRVRECREAADMTLDDLAGASSVAKTTIKEIERGHGPTPTIQLRLAGALNVKVNELFFWEDPPVEAVAS